MARTVKLFKQTFKEFSEDEATARAAGVAYYAALSLAPLVLLFIAISGFLGPDTQDRMVQSIESAVGSQAGGAIEGITARSEEKLNKAGWSLAISLVVILFSASGVVAALQKGLNRIWDVKAAPGGGIKNWIRKRLLSMSLVLGVGLLILISLVATTVIGVLVPDSGALWNLVTLGVSVLVFIVLFAAIFKVLPDVNVQWKDVWFGATVTAVLFAIGKYLVGLYLANASFTDSYGAAGSLIAMLVWVYYAAVITFFGAELTQVRARLAGRAIEPDQYAVRIEEIVHDRGKGADKRKAA